MNLPHRFVSLVLLGLLAACGASQPAPDAHTASTHDEHEASDDATHAELEHTRIEAAIAEEVGIRVTAVTAGVIADEHVVQGLLTPVEGHQATVAARFPGVVRALDAQVGDSVRAGQRLASIDSNLSLSAYAISAPISGVVLARNGNLGAVVSEGAVLFELADLSKLWVDLHLFGADADHIQAGVAVTVTRLSDGAATRTTLERILPGTATSSQSTVARATIVNADGLWRPGSAVTARITVAQIPVARVVPLSAVQRLDGKDVVFVRTGEVYETHPVQLGERDALQVEVRDGVDVGEEIVVEQSFLVKADIEKAGASHEH